LSFLNKVAFHQQKTIYYYVLSKEYHLHIQSTVEDVERGLLVSSP